MIITARKFNFGKINYYNPSGRRINLVTVEMELRRNTDGFPVFSASVDIWNGNHTDYVACGQMLNEIKHVPENDALFQEIKKLWVQYHLNDMHAGTKAQEAMLEKAGIKGNAYSYDKAVECLKRKGLYEVRLTPTEAKYNPRYAGKPYKYGHGWLYRPIPAKDMAKINRIMEM